MRKLLDELSDLGQKALVQEIDVEFGVERGKAAPPRPNVATRPEFGDLQISAAMQLTRLAKKPPRQLAEIIERAVKAHPAVARTEIAGPGFVNIWLRDEFISRETARAAAMPTLGIEPVAHGKVVIDYSSPNVAKPMHIAHIRSTIIGEALKRTMRAVGYEVVADNHLGDWGTQFGKLIVAYRKWLDAAAFERNPVEELLRLYIKFVEEEKSQRGVPVTAADGAEESDEDLAADNAPPILQEARAELVKLQRGDAENLALWKKFVDVSMREFDRVYKRLGVSFDVTLGESFYNDQLAATVALLKSRGIAEESRGATVVFFNKERDGADLDPFLIQKGDGGFLYGTTDIAGMLYREATWHPSRILIVTDERQQLHFKQLFATARRLGITASLEHIWFGLMRLPEGTISTREGKLIGLEALLDEAEKRAYDVAKARAEGLDEKALREVARVVGIGAVKYNDLSKDRGSMVTFTWDRALSLEGNTAPYLQYAYARIQSILRKAAENAWMNEAVPSESVAGGAEASQGSVSTIERKLAAKLLWYPSAVQSVADTTRPHLLCEYLFDVATIFSSFYAEHPVLKAEPAVRASRLALTQFTGQILRAGLDLLGIEVLDRM